MNIRSLVIKSAIGVSLTIPLRHEISFCCFALAPGDIFNDEQGVEVDIVGVVGWRMVLGCAESVQGITVGTELGHRVLL